MNKKKKKRKERALTRAATKYSAKAMANFVRRNGWVCLYISKCRIRRQRQWLTCYDQFNEYEQNHTFINFKMTVFMITWVFDVDFSSSVLLDFPFLFFVYTYIWLTYDHQLKNSKSKHTTDGFYAWDERLSSSFIELFNTSNRTNWHLKEKTGSTPKSIGPLRRSLSSDDYVKQETENGRKKSSTMIIASHLMCVWECDARVKKNLKYTFTFTFPFLSRSSRWTP